MKIRDSIHLSNALCKTRKISFFKSVFEYFLLLTSLIIILFISFSFYISYSNTFRTNSDILIGTIYFSDSVDVSYKLKNFEYVNNHKSIKDSSIYTMKGFRTLKSYSFTVDDKEYKIGYDNQEDEFFLNHFQISVFNKESKHLITKNHKKWLQKNNYGDPIKGLGFSGNEKEIIVNESFLIRNGIDLDIIGKNLSIEYYLNESFYKSEGEKQVIDRKIKMISNYKVVGILNNYLNDCNVLIEGKNPFGDVIINENDCFDPLDNVSWNSEMRNYVYSTDINDLIALAEENNEVFIPTDPIKFSNLICVYDFKDIESLSKLYKRLNSISLDEGNIYNNGNSFGINTLVQSYLHNIDFMNMMVWIIIVMLIFQIISYLLNFYIDISNQYIRLNKFIFISSSFGITKNRISSIFFIHYFKKIAIALIMSIPVSLFVCYRLIIKINEHIREREGLSKFKMNYNYYPLSIIVALLIVIGIMSSIIILKSKSNKYFYISKYN